MYLSCPTCGYANFCLPYVTDPRTNVRKYVIRCGHCLNWYRNIFFAKTVSTASDSPPAPQPPPQASDNPPAKPPA